MFKQKHFLRLWGLPDGKDGDGSQVKSQGKRKRGTDMAKRGKAVEINRNKYNQIRKMDHGTMERCINGYYEQGFQAGERAAGRGAFDLSMALGLIGGIKGIGEVKLNQIRHALAEAGAAEWERGEEHAR